MHIEELKEEREVVGFVVGVQQEEIVVKDLNREEIVVSHAKRALVGAGARVLFYPTLLYNLVRNKIQAEFRWWDQVDEFLLLGAVPFPTDVLRLKELGVCGVVTLNEPYETLVPTSLYHAHNIDHLVIPTRDYLFAPSYADICQAVDFINKNASSGKTTYVHCKAGRGRSTTIVLCYLVQHKQMTPDAAYAYVKSIRSRVLLAPAQRQAVQEFYRLTTKRTTILGQLTMRRPYISHHLVVRTPMLHTPKSIETADSTEFMEGLDPSHFVVKNSDSPTSQGTTAFDDSSVVVVTESDLDGYDGSYDSGIVGNEICAAELSIVYRVQFASQAALARLSGLRLSCIYARQKMSGERLRRENSCSVGADKLGGVGVDIHVY